MLVLFACFDFGSVTVVLLNLSSVFSCIVCLLQCDNMKDAGVARLGKRYFITKCAFFFFFFGGWLNRGVGGLVWSAVSDVSVRALVCSLLSAAVHTYDVYQRESC